MTGGGIEDRRRCAWNSPYRYRSRPTRLPKHLNVGINNVGINPVTGPIPPVIPPLLEFCFKFTQAFVKCRALKQGHPVPHQGVCQFRQFNPQNR